MHIDHGNMLSALCFEHIQVSVHHQAAVLQVGAVMQPFLGTLQTPATIFVTTIIHDIFLEVSVRLSLRFLSVLPYHTQI